MRKTTFAFKPSKREERELHRLLSVTCEVYNAGLRERRDAYRTAGKTVTLHEQFGALTETREARPDIYSYGLQPLRGSLRRLDEAFAAFFRRVKAGRRPATRGSRAGGGSTPRCGTNRPAGRSTSTAESCSSRASASSACRSLRCGSCAGVQLHPAFREPSCVRGCAE